MGSFTYNDPILLDFYVMNAALSSNGNYVALVIDGQEVMKIDSWTPYKILGLARGKHTIAISLFDSKGNPYAEPFGPQKQEIFVK